MYIYYNILHVQELEKIGGLDIKISGPRPPRPLLATLLASIGNV